MDVAATAPARTARVDKPPERPVTERSATELARAIRTRELSSSAVVEAHIARLEAVAPRINALVADRFEAARRDAAAADERVAATKQESTELPPLLGVPFTVKESIALAGMPQATGLLARREYRSADTAP